MPPALAPRRTIPDGSLVPASTPVAVTGTTRYILWRWVSENLLPRPSLDAAGPSTESVDSLACKVVSA